MPLYKRVELLERDESDLAAIKDVEEELERFAEDVDQERLLQQADEGKPQ